MEFKGNHELPSLLFNEEIGLLKIWGKSISMERDDFWNPLNEKMREYLEEPRNISLSIDLEYFNTTSAKAIFDLFKLIEKRTTSMKTNFDIEWVYEDTDIEEAGRDFNIIVKKADWTFIKK